jgi:uncharacterized protein YbcV (DUF1398 family)
MFTLEQIKAAHAKVKSGADFPNYFQDLIRLGVTGYETYVADGNAEYSGKDDFKISSGPKYDQLLIAEQCNAEQFKSDLKAHQQGQTNYATFCNDCAKSGIQKWVIAMENMTCCYYDRTGNEVLTELIPQ